MLARGGVADPGPVEALPHGRRRAGRRPRCAVGADGENAGVLIVVTAPDPRTAPAPAGAGAPAVHWAQVLDDRTRPVGAPQQLDSAGLAAFIHDQDARCRAQTGRSPRWVLERGPLILPGLLAADPSVPLPHLHDLRLVSAILSNAGSAPAAQVDYAPVLEPLPAHEHPGIAPEPPPRSVWNGPGEGQMGLFDDTPDALAGPRGAADDAERLSAVLEELRVQLTAIEGSRSPGKLRLLCALESAGALLAADMHRIGIPWDAEVHRRLLVEALGPQPALGHRPARMEAAAQRVREVLGAAELNPDSPQSLLRALRGAGLNVGSTSQWELSGWVQAAPASSPGERERREQLVAPVLEYKKLSRLLTASGWQWLESWVRDDRFRAEYVVGGVVTGRWAARGGGALQIPKVIRSAVRPGPDRRLVVADAAQLEPRVLAVLARDDALADASRGRDLYLSIAERGRASGTGLTQRDHAKVALLGAMYGATTGESGRLMPQLARLFPQAVAFVEHAARVGEDGTQVCTWLGRWSPQPDQRWQEAVARTASAEDERRAGQLRRSQGRFTRNFVVQGSAAEWAMAWMGCVRAQLRRRGLDAALVFFLHDEIMVDTSAEHAEEVAALVRRCAEQATEIVFGRVPVEFPVSVAIVESYDQAK